ncbi:hypothetical protein HJFPF1_10702 [Paramyrothecium foliicola]|nr:hypothetical protein HJFPF1_10702 [Paramyrothecium foliicola]
MSGRVTEYAWNLQELEVEKVSINGHPEVDEPESDDLQVAGTARPEVDDKPTKTDVTRSEWGHPKVEETSQNQDVKKRTSHPKLDDIQNRIDSQKWMGYLDVQKRTDVQKLKKLSEVDGVYEVPTRPGDLWKVLEGVGGAGRVPSAHLPFPFPTPQSASHPPSFVTILGTTTMSDDGFDDHQWFYNENDLDFSTPVPRDFGTPGYSSQRGQSQLRHVANVNPARESSDRDSCRPYTVNWTLCVKKARLNKLTGNAVQNVEHYPSAFWASSLKSDIDTIISEKGLDENHEPDETQITISINARGEHDVPKRFTGLNIEWNEIDEQIKTWDNLVRMGKKLTIKLTFIFKETGPIALRSGRPRRNATDTQLRERAALHDAQDGLPIWEQVYNLFECPGAGCEVGPYCWRNPETGIRHSVTTSILGKLVEYAEKGGKLKEHGDLLKHHRHEILNPPSKRKQAEGPQINITNVMPGAESVPKAKKLKIPGTQDKAIQTYREWHCDRVDDRDWRRDFYTVGELTFQNRLTLDRLFEAQEEEILFFVSQGIPRGIAHEWVSKVDVWVASLDTGST